jgi:hypothetical protein
MIPQRHKLDWNSNRIPNLIDNATSSSYGNLIGSASTATIVTTKVGTFSSTWKGSGTLYFDPGDGGAVEPLVLTSGGVAWNHEYLSAGSKTIIITGYLGGVTYLSAPANQIVSNLNDIVKNFSAEKLVQLSLYSNSIIGNIDCIKRFTKLIVLQISSNYDLQGSISAISSMIYLLTANLHSCSFNDDLNALTGLSYLSMLTIYNNNLSFTYTQFPPWSGSTYDFHSTVSTQQEVGDLIRAAANGGMNNCIYKLDGTNPAPPSTQEVTDAIATLAGNGVTLYVNT